jgi:hypothetical protein
MTDENEPGMPSRSPVSRRFGHDHKPKSLRYWVIPLLIAVGVIILLPKLLAMVE